MTDIQEIIKQEFGEGQITPKGWINSQGKLLKRSERQTRMNLSVEDELIIDQWNKQMQRDFPSIDIGMIDMISTYCYLHPEEAKAYMVQQTTSDKGEEGVQKNPFTDLENEYEKSS